MAASIARHAVELFGRRADVCYKAVRYRRVWRHPGKPFEKASSFENRVAELNKKDPELCKDINIGLPYSGAATNPRLKHREWAENKHHKEHEARNRELLIPLEDVKENWQSELGSRHIHRIAEHYGIFKDMFDSAFFYPAVLLNVSYDYDEEFVTPVCNGNRIPPAEAAVQPYIGYDSSDETLWTLVMSSPDGHLRSENKECLHWLVANIPGNNVGQGETICDYMQPFPPQGVGLLRYVFVLYKQAGYLDLSEEKRPDKCLSLSHRTFSTLDFYGGLQDILTPAGLAFFQAEWDPSVRSFFREVLEMPEPIFEFIHPPFYHPKQKKYPHKEPFNLYLDRYRDVKDINEEVLREKLKRISPFRENKAQPLYPGIKPFPRSMPSWMKTRMRNMRIGRHQWKDLPGE